MDRLKALEIFKAVAERSSFVKAADALDLSTPVVSRAVQDLETLLGVRLLQRTTRRVSLTAEGEDALQRARVLLESFQELSAMGGQGASRIAGEIRFTAPASFSARLGPALAEFAAQFPDVRISLLATDAPLNLIEDRIDLAFRIARELPDSLIARRVADIRIGVYGAPSYLGRKGMPKHPDDLAQHNCLVHSSMGREPAWPFYHPVTQERIQPVVRGLLWADNAEALMTAAIGGSGLALLPHFMVERAVARGDLQSVLSHWPTPPLGGYVAYASRRNQPARVRKLIEHLIEAIPAIVANDTSSEDRGGPTRSTAHRPARATFPATEVA